MISYQHSVYYQSQSGYRKVASIFISQVANTLELIFAVMNGQPATEGMRVRYFFNPMSLRPMALGDVVEVNGKAYYASTYGFEQTEYCADHAYPLYIQQVVEQEQVYYDPETGMNEDLYDHFANAY